MYERFGKGDLVPEIDLPEDAEHLWDWFWEINRRRQSGMNGPQPISHEAIAMWSAMTGEILLREELKILTRMDDAYVSAVAKAHEDQQKANKRPGD